jgi:hypothetical protein
MAAHQYGRAASPSSSNSSSSSIGSSSFGSSSDAAGQQQQQRISPLAALMWHIHRLVNPPDLVNKMQVEIKTVADGVAYDTTAQTLMQLSQAAAAAGSNGSSEQQQQQQQQRMATVPINVAEVTVLGSEQVQQLAAYLVEGAALPWPQPQFQVGFKTQLALAAHAKLFGTPAAAAYSSSHSSSSSEPLQLPEQWSLPEGLLAMQRPPLKGRHAAKVRSLHSLGF